MKQGHIFTRKVDVIDEVAWLQFSDLAKRIIEEAEGGFAFSATDERVGEVDELPSGVPRELFSGLEFKRFGEAGSEAFVQIYGPHSRGAALTAAFGFALQYRAPGAYTWKFEGIGAESVMGGAELFQRVAQVHISVGGELDEVQAYFGDEAVAYAEEMKRKGVKPELANDAGREWYGGESVSPIAETIRKLLGLLSDDSPEDLKMQMEAMEEAMQEAIDFDKTYAGMSDELKEETRKTLLEVGDNEKSMCASVAQATYQNAADKDPLCLLGTDDRGAAVSVDFSHLPLGKFSLEERQDWVRRYIRTLFSKGATRVYFVSKGRGEHGPGVAASLYKPGQGHVITAMVYLDENGEVIKGKAGIAEEGYLKMGASN